MAHASTITFTRLADGTLLQRQSDGSFRPATSDTDHDRLAKLTDAQIEAMSVSDPDHPALDDDFWQGVDARPPAKEAISIKLDQDVLAFFREQGRGYQTRINMVLRRYMEARRKGSGA